MKTLKRILKKSNASKKPNDQKLVKAFEGGDYFFLTQNVSNILHHPNYFLNLAVSNHHSFLVWLLVKKLKILTPTAWDILLTEDAPNYIILRLFLECNLQKIDFYKPNNLHLCRNFNTLEYLALNHVEIKPIQLQDSPLSQSQKMQLYNISSWSDHKKSALVQKIDEKKFNEALEYGHSLLHASSYNFSRLNVPPVIFYLANLCFGYEVLQNELSILPQEINFIILSYSAAHIFHNIDVLYSRFNYRSAFKNLTEETASFCLNRFFAKYEPIALRLENPAKPDLSLF